ncbi:hypothetical protein AX17_007222 [Amanita inopinata Kibby_2008]|nr:hypothetical protein AX17_007222 [Amanita inopinata Kibby_2008]
MDDHSYEPPSLPPPPTHPATPQVIQPIQPSLGVMATMVFQDGTVNEISEHIATAAHCLAKSFLDGDANFIPDIASIDRFLGNYIFDSFEDKVKAFQEVATEFKLLGYSITANGFVHHEKLSRFPLYLWQQPQTFAHPFYHNLHQTGITGLHTSPGTGFFL